MAKERINHNGKDYELWYSSNTTDERNSKDLIEANGGEALILKGKRGCAFYYRGVDLDNIPQSEFEKYSR